MIKELALRKWEFVHQRFARYILASALAGAFISFGSFVSMTCGGLCAELLGPANKLVMAFAFASALSFIIAGGGELFTGNNIVMTIGWQKKSVDLWKVAEVFYWCWVGNFIGSWLMVGLFHLSGADSTPIVLKQFADVAQAKCSLGWMELIARGVLCNIMVCLAVLCSLSLEDYVAKLIMVFWCIFVFMVCGFEHSIANMSIIGAALVNDWSWDFFALYWRNLTYVTIGNIIGGALLGMAYITAYKK